MSNRAHVPAERSGPIAPDDVPVALIEFARGRGVTAVNAGWTALTGLDEEASLGDGWLAAVGAEHRSLAVDQLERAAAGERVCGEWRLAAATGGERWLALRAGGATDGNGGRCLAALIDVSADRAREQELRHRATHDGLTGLLTRAVFVEEVGRALARRRRRPDLVAVLFVDLDRFKAINDHYGHGLGDGVLAESARRLARSVRPSDSVARVGGDEFAVLCDDLSSRQDAVRVAERILRGASISLRSLSRVAVPDVSIGIAFADGDDDTAERLLNRADQAMYRAKQLGRGRYAIFDGGSAATGEDEAGDAGRQDWRQSREEIMTHICNSVILLTEGRNEDRAFARRVHPAVVELDAALAELRTVQTPTE